MAGGGKPEEQTNESHRTVLAMVVLTVTETAGGHAELGIGWPQALLAVHVPLALHALSPLAVECSWSFSFHEASLQKIPGVILLASPV